MRNDQQLIERAMELCGWVRKGHMLGVDVYMHAASSTMSDRPLDFKTDANAAAELWQKIPTAKIEPGLTGWGWSLGDRHGEAGTFALVAWAAFVAIYGGGE